MTLAALLNKVPLSLLILSMVIHSSHAGCDFFDQYATANNLTEGTDWLCGTSAHSDNGMFFFVFHYIHLKLYFSMYENRMKQLLAFSK